MDSEELLAQLADIHLPQAVSLWPPAPGWWILALLLIVTAWFLTRRFLRKWRRRQICRYALAELNSCYEHYAGAPADAPQKARLSYINNVNSVLRRVALEHFPQADVAGLGGRAWVDFIREKGDSSHLNDEIAAALSYGRFQTECDVDVDAVNQLGAAWITSVYMGSSAGRGALSEPQNRVHNA